MGTRSIIAYKTKDTTELFETGTYVHWDGYPSHMGKSWWEIAKHPMFGGNLSSMVEYFVIGNPIGWSVIDWRRDITLKPVSPETSQKFFGYDTKVPEDKRPLVSYVARRWDIMQQFGYTNIREAEKDPRCTQSMMWEDDNIITPEAKDNCGAEWLYIIDVDARTLQVIELHYSRGDIDKGTFNLDGDEPDWENM